MSWRTLTGQTAGTDSKDREGVTVDASDQELQQYLFDLQGYLVIHNVLGAAEVAELNRLIDAQRLPSPRERIRFGSAAGLHGPDHGFLNWGEPFCRLLDHEAILPILRLRLGDCFRLDRLYGIRMLKGSRPRAPDSALQVFRLPGSVVAGAGPSATRCPAHPATASAPHRAGRSTYVRSVTLQRRTRREAVDRKASGPAGGQWRECGYPSKGRSRFLCQSKEQSQSREHSRPSAGRHGGRFSGC